MCRCCQPSRGMELLQEMAQHGLQPDVITINTLLDGFCCAGQVCPLRTRAQFFACRASDETSTLTKPTLWRNQHIDETSMIVPRVM